MTRNTKNLESMEKEKQLLSSEEQAILSQIATKEPPHSQRAQGLLAINEGATQAEAGRLAGLTKGQVRYWLTKFRRDRTGIFPDELLIQAQQVEAGSRQSSAKQAASPDVPEIEQPDDEDAQQGLLDEEETTGPADAVPVVKEDRPKVKKKKSKEAKKSVKTKEQKKDKKASKRKKPEMKTKKDNKALKGKRPKKKTKKDKKALKGKKSKKETKKDKSQKTKGKKGKSSKKRRK
jgi:hypothetical protein